MAMTDTVNRVVKEWANNNIQKKIPARIRRLMAMATLDLYSGPLPHDYSEETGFGRKGNTRWPGFVLACDAIKDALQNVDVIDDIWVDIDCEEVMMREPEGFFDGDERTEENWVEPRWEDIYHLDRKEVLAHVVDKELVHYIS